MKEKLADAVIVLFYVLVWLFTCTILALFWRHWYRHILNPADLLLTFFSLLCGVLASVMMLGFIGGMTLEGLWGYFKKELP